MDLIAAVEGMWQVATKSNWNWGSYLCVVDHVDALVDDVFGVFTEEFENVLHLGFVRQSAEAYAVLPGAGSDQLLRQ